MSAAPRVIELGVPSYWNDDQVEAFRSAWEYMQTGKDSLGLLVCNDPSTRPISVANRERALHWAKDFISRGSLNVVDDQSFDELKKLSRSIGLFLDYGHWVMQMPEGDGR
jgi:hypothetical protein